MEKKRCCKRQAIDAIDAQILALLGERLRLVRTIARIKKENQLPILDTEREQIIKSQLRKKAHAAGLSTPVIEELFTLLLDYMRIEMEAVK